MDTNFQPDINTRAGTIGGTLLVLLLHLQADELLKTALLAAVGATVSFMVSMVLKFIIRCLRRKENEK